MTADVDTQTATCDRKHYDDQPCTRTPGHLDKHLTANGETWHNYGPLTSWEITWMSGHIETVHGHQVTYPHAGLAMAGSIFGGNADTGAPRILIHGEINGRWRLVLAAREEDIRTMRDVTGGEPKPTT